MEGLIAYLAGLVLPFLAVIFVGWAVEAMDKIGRKK